MSTASRQPLPAAARASFPAMVDRASGRIDRRAVRKELRYLTTCCSWSHADALVMLMQKARRQLAWSRQDAADRAVAQAQAEAAFRGIEIEAQAVAAQHGYDVAVLSFAQGRYQFGSLAHSLDAEHKRAVYRRALSIACERKATQAREKLRLPARAMRPGDVVGSGETVVSVSAGVRTPAGKVDVTLEKDGRRRTSTWGARTEIGVTRAVAVAGA